LVGVANLNLGSEVLPCQTLDVAMGGLAVIAPSRPPPGSPVHIGLRLGKDSSWIDMDGMVVRESVRNGRLIWGLRFAEVDPGTRTRLRDFIARRIRPGAAPMTAELSEFAGLLHAGPAIP
jgi:hypothetical protein